jgi:hypothetical protein
MFKKLFFVLTIIMSFQPLSAEELFPECLKTNNDKTYLPLNQYLNENNISADNCQRLNNHEYIYTTWQNFFYCDFKSTNNSACHEQEEGTGRYYPNPMVKKSFYGSNKKQFVLFETHLLRNGLYSSSYQVFFFVPKNLNSRGYEIIDLKNSGEFNGTYSDLGMICSNLDVNDNAIELINYKIINQGKSNVSINFTQKITSCKTNQSKIRTLEYMWTGKTFELLK